MFNYLIKLIVALMLMSLLACSDKDKDNADGSQKSSADGSPTSAEGSQTSNVETEQNSQDISPLPATPIKENALPFSKVGTHMILGTGSVQGAYFPIGGVICRLLNRHKSLHNVRCSVESTAGSIYNLRELRDGNFGLVVSQSDWQYHAYNGSSTFEKEGANKNLRAVFALEADPIVLIVRADSDISTFTDLQGRVVSFGYERSLQHRIVNDLLAVMGWTDDNFENVVRMSDPNQINGLCSEAVEATLFLMSSLDDYLRDIDESCLLKMVPIEGEHVKQVIADQPYYRVATVPVGKYLGGDEEIKSFGLGAVFVASESTSVKAIYNVVKEVVENFKDFRALHPSLQTIELNELPYAGIAIPLHVGAIRYYREARLLR